MDYLVQECVRKIWVEFILYLMNEDQRLCLQNLALRKVRLKQKHIWHLFAIIKKVVDFLKILEKILKKQEKREKPLYLENELEMKQRLYYLLREQFWVRQLVLWQVGHLEVRLEVLLEVLVESI